MTLGRAGFVALVAAASLYAVGARAAGSESQESQGQQGGSAKQGSSGQAKEKSASGKVSAIDSKALTLDNGEQFRITDQTQFLREGQKVSRNEVKQGEQVRAAYEARGPLAYATRVDVQAGSEGKSSKDQSKSKSTEQSKGTGEQSQHGMKSGNQ